MQNETIDKVVVGLNSAWQDLEFAINGAYDEGYTAMVWKLKQIQLSIENLEGEIQAKEYGDDDE